MPIWAPPTPPQDDSDVYMDYSTCFIYEPNVMTESQLPPVYIKKEHKRTRLDNNCLTLAKKQKTKKDENYVNYPRSLFDRPSAAVLKMRKDAKMQRFRPNTSGSVLSPSTAAATASSAQNVYKNPQLAHKQVVEPQQNAPEWLIDEDWALLQAVQCELQLPLNLMIVSPGHTPNWDFISEVVNFHSRTFRSPKHCRIRYETIVVPREEGKILYDINPNKSKKSKGIYRLGCQTKNNRPMKTSQLFAQDNNASFTQLYHSRFESMKSLMTSRMPSTKHLMSNSNARNPKHTSVLADSGINFDQPLSPMQVAALRAERINPAGSASAQVLPSSGLQLAARPQQPQSVSQQQILTASQQQQMASTTQAVIGQITAQQLQSVIGRITVTTASALTSATLTSSVRPQRAAATAAVGVTQMRNVIPQQQQQPTVVSVSNAGQMQQVVVTPSQRVTPTAVVTSLTPGALSAQVVASSGKSPTQLQLYTRNPTLYKQQRLQAAQQHQITTISVQQATQQQQQAGQQKIPVSVTSLLSPNVATVQLTQSQQQQLRNQAVTRAITEAEVTQLIKRQQLQLQQQQKAAAQVTQIHVPSAGGGQSGPQIQQQMLSAAQLQQLQHQQQQSVAAAIASGQTSFATLVKTVSTPAALGTAGASAAGTGGSASPTVTIPVNINVSLPQVKATAAKAAIGAVQLVPQGAAGHKGVPTTVTVQHFHQVMKQAQSNAAGGLVATTTANLVSAQSLPHTFITKTGQTITQPSAVTAALQARVVPLGQNVSAVVPPGLSQATGTTRQTIRVVTTSPHGQLRLPATGGVSTSGSTFTIDGSRTGTGQTLDVNLTLLDEVTSKGDDVNSKSLDLGVINIRVMMVEQFDQA
ncbi:hypothetical protein CHUAL_005854 [Chamberlinius hualienensis]